MDQPGRGLAHHKLDKVLTPTIPKTESGGPAHAWLIHPDQRERGRALAWPTNPGHPFTKDHSLTFGHMVADT